METKMVFDFGEVSPGAQTIEVPYHISRLLINRGTILNPEFDDSRDALAINIQSLSNAIEESTSKLGLNARMVVLFDNWDECGQYYAKGNIYYQQVDLMRVIGWIKAIDLNEKKAIIELKSRSLFRPSLDGNFKLINRAIGTVEGNEFIYSKIITFDLIKEDEPKND